MPPHAGPRLAALAGAVLTQAAPPRPPRPDEPAGLRLPWPDEPAGLRFPGPDAPAGSGFALPAGPSPLAALLVALVLAGARRRLARVTSRGTPGSCCAGTG